MKELQKSKILIFGDLHSHNWQAFSKLVVNKEYGRINSRLQDILNVLKQIRELGEAENVKGFWFLGDLFHKRGVVNTEVFNIIYREMMKFNLSKDREMIMIPGNHDISVKGEPDEKDISFHRLSDINGIRVITKPEVIEYADFGKVLFIPYSSTETVEEILINYQNKVDTVCLHQDILGSSIDGYKMKTGLRIGAFNTFSNIFCGHIHHPQTLKNITIVGAPLAHTFKDKDQRGVFLFDGKSRIFHSMQYPKFITVNTLEEIPDKEDNNFYRVLSPIKLGEKISSKNPNVIVTKVPETTKRTETLSLGSTVQSILSKYIDIMNPKDKEEILKYGENVIKECSFEDTAVLSTYKLQSVELQNFLSYKHEKFDVVDGMWLLQGKNGAGKTSLFEAIRWALYGEATKKRYADDVINWESKGDCFVKLVFTEGNKILTVTNYRKHKEHGSNLIAMLDGQPIGGGTSQEIRKNVHKLLGVSSALYDKIIYFSQSKYKSFLEMTEYDKKEFLTLLLGLERYDEAAEIVKKHKKEVEKKLQENEMQRNIQQELHKKTTDNIAVYNEKINEEQNNKQKEIAEIDKEVQQLQEQLDELTDFITQFPAYIEMRKNTEIEIPDMAPDEEFLQKKQNLSSTNETLQKMIEQQENELNNMTTQNNNELFGEIDNLSFTIDVSTKQKEEITHRIQEELTPQYNQCMEQLSTCRTRVHYLDEQIKEAEQLKNKCPTCHQDISGEFKQELIDNYTQQRAGFLKEQSEIEEKRYIIDKEKNEMDKKIQHLTTKIETAKELIKEIKQTLSEKDNLQAKIDRNKEKIQSNNNELTLLTRLENEQYDNYALSIKQKAKEEIENEIKLFENKKKDAKHLTERVEEQRKQKEKIQSKPSSFTELLKQEIENQQICENTLQECALTEKELKAQTDRITFWITGFGNTGIKNLLIDNFAGMFNNIINDYMEIVSEGRTSVVMTTQTQLQSTKEIKEKIDIIVIHDGHETDFSLISGGEGRRVDLGVLFALNEAARHYYGLEQGVFGFVILDEIFSFLDEAGYETATTLIQKLNEKISSIYIISHQEQLKSYVSNILEIKKTEEGSKIVRNISNIRNAKSKG